VVGDFNGDGTPDLAVANTGDNTISVLLGNGDGTFQNQQQTYATGLAPLSIAVGDFRGNGRLDLAVANRDDITVSVLLGNGDGTFQKQQTYDAGTAPISVVVGDINGDGKDDLVVANDGDNTVSVLLGNGDGTFQAGQTYATGTAPLTVAVGDFNGDNRLDMAVTSSFDNTLSVLVNRWAVQAIASNVTVPGSGSTHAVFAAYDGDALYVPSTSGTVNVTSSPTAYIAPQIDLLSPMMIAAGSPAFTLTVEGANFDTNAVVRWNGADLVTTFFSGTELTALVPAADVATVGTAQITVYNPASGSGLSPEFAFAINTAANTAGAITVSATSATVTVTQGQAAPLQVNISNAPATAQITVACLNLPAGATCTYNRATSTVSIGTLATTPQGTYNITIVFTATQPAASLVRARTFWAVWIGLLGVPMGLLWMGGGRKKTWRRVLIAMLGLMLLTVLAGCGGGTSHPNTVTSQAAVAVKLVVN
jgi:hypothetical protein